MVMIEKIVLSWGRYFFSGSDFRLRNNYFLHWNYDEKSWFGVFFHEWNEWKNPQLNFSSQNLSIEHNCFKWDGKLTKIWHNDTYFSHRIWKNIWPNIKLIGTIYKIQNKTTYFLQYLSNFRHSFSVSVKFPRTYNNNLAVWYVLHTTKY